MASPSTKIGVRPRSVSRRPTTCAIIMPPSSPRMTPIPISSTNIASMPKSMPPSLRRWKQFNQGDRQEDRHRIVGAGLDFQCRAHLVADVDAADTQQEEDGGRIRRGDDRAEQQALEPAEVKKPHGRHAKEAGRQQHPRRGKRQRRDGSELEGLDRGAEAGIEQNHGKRDRAESVSETVIAEFDAETVNTCKQADRQKQQKERSAEAKGE